MKSTPAHGMPHESGGAKEWKLLIAGGGTGGHVFPALAVVHEWLSRGKNRDIVFVGTERGMEMRLLPEAGLKLETIRSAGLKGMGPVRLARNLMQLGPALWDSDAILRRHQFAAAFGVGGYAAGPVMLMAAMHDLPSVIFEPNAEPGFTNRILADMATRNCRGLSIRGGALGKPRGRNRLPGAAGVFHLCAAPA